MPLTNSRAIRVPWKVAKGTGRKGMKVRYGVLFCSCFLIFVASQASAQGTSQTPSAPQPTQARKLFIEERIMTTTGGSVHCDDYGNCYGSSGTSSRDVSLEVTRAVMKSCPSLLTVTNSKDAADFDLRISPGSSTLYKRNGDVAYISPARFRVSNLVKDICAYASTHP